MTLRRMHTHVKINFADPYVVRVEYKSESEDNAQKKYREIIRKTYRTINGMWGYSRLNFEEIFESAVVGPITIKRNCSYTDYAYVCFKEELDALQFCLSLDGTAKRVTMWPSRIFFTIHECLDNE